MLNFDTTPIVNAIAQVETGNRVVVGDGGRALSVYQIHEAFWLDVHAWLGRQTQDHETTDNGPAEKSHRPTVSSSHSLPVDIGPRWPDIGGVDQTSQLRARNTATCGLLMLAEWLEHHNQPVTPENLYAAFTVGRQEFLECNFDIHHPKFPAFKCGKCVRVGLLVQAAQQEEP